MSITVTNCDQCSQSTLKRMKELNVNVTFAPPEERAKWMAATKSIHEDYIKQLEAKGLPGKKVYDEINRLLEKYSK